MTTRDPSMPVAADARVHQIAIDRVVSNGCRFDFFQAVWLLERMIGSDVPCGHRGPASRESFRFRPDVSMAFPSTDVHLIEERRTADGRQYLIEVTFLGLYGVSTPLPLHYAVDVLRSADTDEETVRSAGGVPSARASLRDFLDVFHHRLISLFYRAWLKYRYDRAFGMPGRDTITDYLLWLIGCPRSYDRATLGVPPLELLRYAGVLTQHPRSAATLEGVLLDYWQGLPVQVQQCTGRWVAVSPSDQNRLGARNCTLGVDLTTGEEVYDLSGSFNLTIGPMDWSTYLLFLPGEPCWGETVSFVRLYCCDPLSFTVELALREAQAPPTRLSSEGSAGRLGYTTWLRTSDVPATSVTFATTAENRVRYEGRYASAGPTAEPAKRGGAAVADKAAAW